MAPSAIGGDLWISSLGGMALFAIRLGWHDWIEYRAKSRPGIFETMLYEEGNVTGDEDRQTALDRMTDTFGGEKITVSQLMVRVPQQANYLESIILRHDVDDTTSIDCKRNRPRPRSGNEKKSIERDRKKTTIEPFHPPLRLVPISSLYIPFTRTPCATMRQLEADWQRQLGKERFADLKAMLKEL